MASAQKLNSVTSTNPLIPGLPNGNNEVIFSWFRSDHSVAYNRVPNSNTYTNISDAPIFTSTYASVVPYQFAYNTNVAEDSLEGRTYMLIYRRALNAFANASGAAGVIIGANNNFVSGRPRIQYINANNMLQLTGVTPSPNGATLQVSGNTSQFRFIAAVVGNNEVSKIYNLTDATESSETYVANVYSGFASNANITIGSGPEGGTANRGSDIMLVIVVGERLPKTTIDQYYNSIKQILYLNEGFTDI
jgi:hypothetical protein